MNNSTNTAVTETQNKKRNLIYSSIRINAAPPAVWQILMDFENYPNWNPFIKKIDGNPQIGQKIKAIICPPGQKEMTFTPIVLQNTTNKEFRWKGCIGASIIFAGEHCFVLEETENNTTTFHHFEHFSGILAPLLLRIMEANTLSGFEKMNKQLKVLAEAKPTFTE